MQGYVSRVNELVNQMRGLGDTIPDQLPVAKVLRSLGLRFNYVVAAIEESNDLTKLTMDELSGTLQAHEARMISQADEPGEKAFTMKVEA